MDLPRFEVLLDGIPFINSTEWAIESEKVTRRFRTGIVFTNNKSEREKYKEIITNKLTDLSDHQDGNVWGCRSVVDTKYNTSSVAGISGAPDIMEAEDDDLIYQSYFKVNQLVHDENAKELSMVGFINAEDIDIKQILCHSQYSKNFNKFAFFDARFDLLARAYERMDVIFLVVFVPVIPDIRYTINETEHMQKSKDVWVDASLDTSSFAGKNPFVNLSDNMHRVFMQQEDIERIASGNFLVGEYFNNDKNRLKLLLSAYFFNKYYTFFKLPEHFETILNKRFIQLSADHLLYTSSAEFKEEKQKGITTIVDSHNIQVTVPVRLDDNIFFTTLSGKVVLNKKRADYFLLGKLDYSREDIINAVGDCKPILAELLLIS